MYPNSRSPAECERKEKKRGKRGKKPARSSLDSFRHLDRNLGESIQLFHNLYGSRPRRKGELRRILARERRSGILTPRALRDEKRCAKGKSEEEEKNGHQPLGKRPSRAAASLLCLTGGKP